jgi:hypothetical protein
MDPCAAHVRFWPKAGIGYCNAHVRFSNRPFKVKRFQAGHQYSVDVARGLVLLFGIGTRALPSWDSKTRRNNLSGGLAVERTAGPSGHTNSPHPSSRKGLHRSVEIECSPIVIDPGQLSCCCNLPGPLELGAVDPYAVHDHAQPTR